MTKRPHTGHVVLATIKWLEESGYTVSFRTDGWTDCLVALDDERWLGHGGTESGALEDALRRMFPSRLSQRLLERSRAERAIRDADRPASAEAKLPSSNVTLAYHPAITDLDLLPDTDPDCEAPTVSIPTVVIDVPPPREVRPISIPTIVAQDDQRDHTPVSAPWPRPSGIRTRPRRPGEDTIEIAAVPTVDVEESAIEVGIISDLIRSNRPELALMTPERQRLAILGWICHARSAEAASGRHPAIQARVTDIARALSRLCKIWWPGSVKALQIDATPRDVGRELELPMSERPRNWSSAAAAAEDKLRRVEERDEGLRRDEYGWSDTAFLDPPPTRPEDQLVELEHLVESLGGPLNKVPGPAPDGVKRPSRDEKERLTRWISRVRWLRGFVTEFERWGAVMGRLRWMVASLERRDPALEQLLGAEFHPRLNWASELGQDPELKRKQRLRKQVLQSRPRADQNPETEAVITWLLDAFAVLDAERIARLVVPFESAVSALSPDELPDATRQKRRRLRKVQEHLTTLTQADYDEAVKELPGSDADTGVFAVVEDEKQPDPQERIVEAVLPVTRGKRALFVSNRADPDLQQTIEDAFGFKELTWCEGNPRRVQAVAAQVTSGTFDIVMGATGFQSHSMDTHLIRACRRASIPYVRVHRGRRLATALALAREFGIKVA